MPRHHRISRSLLGLLGVVLVIGLVFYLNNVRKTSASEAPVEQKPIATAVSKRDAVASINPPAPAPAPAIAPAHAPTPVPATPRVTVTGTRSNASPAPTRLTQSPTPGLPASAGRDSNLLTDATAKKTAGELLAARKMLNDALLSGRLSRADADAAKRMIADINQTVVFSPKVFAGDEYSSSYTVKSGDLLRTIGDRHDIPWELLLRLNGMTDPRKLRAGQNLKIVNGPFHAVVYKGNYTMDIYLGSPGEKGSMYVRSFNVGLGANDSTPTGTWLVETHKKIKNPTYFSPRGEGIIHADDPANPLGERWIGLTGIDGQAVGKQSYGIHGTIEPESIGKQASMGCIRLRNEDVELVFDMLSEGKSVVVVRD